MTISVDWAVTKVVTIQKADMVLVQSTPIEVYDLDIDVFRLTLSDLNDDVDGRPWQKTYKHNTEVVLGGLIYARTVEFLEPYTFTFEDGQYAVNLIGANSNLADRVNVNQVSVRTNNSGGLISTKDIEYASFDGGISFHDTEGFEGSGKAPNGANIGTPQAPSKNMYDSRIIAAYRGLTKGYIRNNLDFPMYELDGFTPFQIDNFEMIGAGQDKTTITIPDLANIVDCQYKNARIVGYVDGITTMINCKIEDATGLTGTFEYCMIKGRLVLGLGESHFIDPNSGVIGVGTPIIDYNGPGTSAAFRGQRGGMLHTNKTGTDSVSCDLLSGQIKLDLEGNFGTAGIINGTFVARGVGKVVEATSGAYLPTGNYGNLYLMNETIGKDNFSAGRYNNRVHVDVNSGNQGSTDPYGLLEYPVDNYSNMTELRSKYSLRQIYFLSDFTLKNGEDIRHSCICSEHKVITCEAGSITDAVEFGHITVSGVVTGEQDYDFSILKNLSGIAGHLNKCEIIGDLYFVGDAFIKECMAPLPCTIHATTVKLNIPDSRGFITFADLEDGGKINVAPNGGAIVIDASCIGGAIYVDNIGNASITDNSGDDCSVVIKNFTTEAVSTTVWNSLDYNHPAGSHGEMLHRLKYLERKVYLNTEALVNGDGSQDSPFKIQQDAADFAEAEGITTLVIYADITPVRNFKNFKFEGVGAPTIDLNGNDFEGAEFYHCKLEGAHLGVILAENCVLLNSLEANGSFSSCGTLASLKCQATGNVVLRDCFNAHAGAYHTVISMNSGSPSNLSIQGGDLRCTVAYCDHVDDVVSVALNSGHLIFDSTCTLGTMIALGTCEFDNETGRDDIIIKVLSPDTVANAVLDEVA